MRFGTVTESVAISLDRLLEGSVEFVRDPVHQGHSRALVWRHLLDAKSGNLRDKPKGDEIKRPRGRVHHLNKANANRVNFPKQTSIRLKNP